MTDHLKAFTNRIQEMSELDDEDYETDSTQLITDMYGHMVTIERKASELLIQTVALESSQAQLKATLVQMSDQHGHARAKVRDLQSRVDSLKAMFRSSKALAKAAASL